MRELGGVCLRCQFRLLVASRARARRALSSWSSAAACENGATHAAGTAEASGTSQPSETDRTSSRTQPHHGGRTTPSPSTPAPPLPAAPLPPRRASLAMFQSIVENHGRASAVPGAPAAAAASIDLVKDIAKMQTMLERDGATLAAAYSFFLETIHPQITKEGAGIPQIVKNQVATVLLDRLALEKPRDFESADIPSVTRITEIMVELDVLRPVVWATLVLELIRHICRQSTSPEDYSSIESYENAMGRRDALLRDLVGAWGAFCEQRAPAQEDRSAAEPAEGGQSESWQPPLGKQSPSQPQPTLQKTFGSMFPKYLGPTLLRPTFAAYATYKLLTDPFNRSRSIEEAGPFLHMMKTLIFQSRPPQVRDFMPVFETFPDLRRFVRPPKRGKSKGNTFFFEAVPTPGDSSESLAIAIHRQLGQAIKIKSLGAVQQAWARFWGEAAVPDADRVRELQNHPDLFDYFILAYMSLRRPQLAIDAWDKMERIGVKPTVKTWNSMLQGCTNANNADGIRTVWRKLVASGIKLDTPIWTARISGLFASGDPDGGLRALDEMARVWAARGDPANAAAAVQPTVEPVNAAVAGLIRFGRDADAKKVLAWAAKQGINPDIYTFNTLLRPLIRRGDMAAIDGIFATMQSVNIRADVTTFTVLLEGALADIGILDPPQQIELVKRVLDVMRSSGVEINMQAYAKLIHLLLREGDRAGEPVKVVLAHIWRRGLELTSHIYTMLADYYLSRDPPDTAAVTALIENRRLHANPSIDRVFWERVLSGYCHAVPPDLPRALAIFDRLRAQGSTLSFGPLYDLLRALVLVGDRPTAARVVDAVKQMKRADEVAAIDVHGDGKRFWRHRFWNLAYEQGLMGEQTASRFKQATDAAAAASPSASVPASWYLD